MNELEQFAARAPFDLDGFVEAANLLLPQFLPDDDSDARGDARGDARLKGEVNVRLVRHLATLGLLDEAGREGREARYEFRHLLQLLVVRRLMAEGHTTSAIKKMTANVGDQQLQALLRGETRAVLQSDNFELAPAVAADAATANAALDFLRNIRQSSAQSPVSPTQTPAVQTPVTRWTRVEIAPGLELHRSDDYAAPATPHERELLLKRIESALKTKAKRSPRR